MPKLPKILAQPSKLISLPARVDNYLKAQSGQLDAPYLLPLSCSLTVADTIENLLKAMIWIKRGAGVKLILMEDMPKANPTDSSKLIRVQDSLLTDKSCEGDMGIYEALCTRAILGDGLDFSLLRPKGSPCRGGLQASGRESFEALANALDAYRYEPSMFSLLYLIGSINQIMLQGGFKKGIITTSYPASGKLLDEYLAVDLGQIPGSLKREVRFKEGDAGLEELANLTDSQKFAIAEARNFSSLMLAKEKTDSEGRTLYSNVCEGIYLKPNDSCLIIRVPLGRLTIEQIVPAYKEAFKFGKALWTYWHKHNDGKLEYSFNDASIDRQIAIDPFGLANLLAHYKITYRDFISALKSVREHYSRTGRVPQTDGFTETRLAIELWKAHLAVAKLNNGFFERVFTVEPSQSHAFRETDLKGYTFARGIWAVWNDVVQRDSNHDGQTVHYYPSFETIKTQPDYVRIQEEISHEWFLMMDSTGLAHAISHDTYYEFTVDALVNWLMYSPLPSLYYDFHREANQVVTKTVTQVDLSGIDLTPACDPTAGFCQVCGA